MECGQQKEWRQTVQQKLEMGDSMSIAESFISLVLWYLVETATAQDEDLEEVHPSL